MSLALAAQPTVPSRGGESRHPSHPWHPSDAGVVRLLSVLAKAAALVATLVGASVLAGWFWDVAALRSGGSPGYVTMKFNTALSFVVAGCALLMLQQPRARAHWWLARSVAAIVCAGAALTLSQYVFGWDAGIDQFLYPDQSTAVGTSSPGRMAPMTAFNFILIGLALLALSDEEGGRQPAQLLAALVAFTATISVLGYLYGVPQIRVNPVFTTMAIHTALSFLLLALALLGTHGNSGFMRAFVSAGPGGTWLRRLVPAMLAFAVALGWLRLQGERIGLYGTEFGVVLLATALCAFVTIMSLVAARAIDAAEVIRLRAALALQRWAHLFEHAGWGVALLDAEGARVGGMNPAFARLSGRPRESGPAVLELFRPDDRPRAGQAVAEALAVGHTSFEAAALRPDGSILPCLVELSALRDAAGRVISVGMNLQDVSSLKVAEQRALEANRELEAFSYSVAHDLRAPLRGINGFTRILETRHAQKLDDDARACLKQVAAGAVRMGQLIDDLLGLARVSRASLVVTEVDLAAMAREVCEDLQRRTPDRRVDVVIAPGLTVQADPKLMRIVMENLLGNAWKYSSRRADARVEVGSEPGPGPKSTVLVRDNGAGFDMAYAAKLFGTFQRLHSAEEFEGTGIGLATVRRIIHRHGGEVWGEGAVGVGATFRFWI